MPVVDFLDEDADRRLGFHQVAIGPAVDLLLLERRHEALRPGVVVGAAQPAHARLHLVGLQQLHVLAAGVLHVLGRGVLSHQPQGEAEPDRLRGAPAPAQCGFVAGGHGPKISGVVSNMA